MRAVGGTDWAQPAAEIEAIELAREPTAEDLVDFSRSGQTQVTRKEAGIAEIGGCCARALRGETLQSKDGVVRCGGASALLAEVYLLKGELCVSPEFSFVCNKPILQRPVVGCRQLPHIFDEELEFRS